MELKAIVINMKLPCFMLIEKLNHILTVYHHGASHAAEGESRLFKSQQKAKQQINSRERKRKGSEWDVAYENDSNKINHYN